MEFLASPWALASILVVCITIIIIVIKHGKVSASSNGLSIGEESRPQPIMPEKYAREVLFLVERSGDHRDKLRDIREQAIEEQTRAYEETEISLTSLFKDGFRDILETKKLSVEDSRRELGAFSLMTRVMYMEVKDSMIRWFKINHYYEMDTQEKAAYIESKQRTISGLLQDIFDQDWVSNIISSTELRHILGSKQVEYNKLIESLFTRVFQISEKADADGKAEKSVYSSYMVTVTGHDPYKEVM